jgi:hypothetical protein
MPFEPGRFYLGVNIAWLNDDFGYDFGYNPYILGKIPLYDRAVEPDICDVYFADIATQGFEVIRLWLFERLEGLLFDPVRFDPAEIPDPAEIRPWRRRREIQQSYFLYNWPRVTGVDPSLLTNVRRVMQKAQNHGIQIYWCILSTAGVAGDPDAPSNWAINQLIHSPDLRTEFWQNAFRPFLSTIREFHSNVFAIDLVNEPEGLASPWHHRTELDEGIRGYISEGANICREPEYDYACSVGFSKRNTVRENAEFLRDNHLTFFDFHSYGSGRGLEVYRATDYSDMPNCIVGEFGSQVRQPNDIRLSEVIRNYMNNAWECNYNGCFIWRYGPRYSNRHRHELLNPQPFRLVKTEEGPPQLDEFLENLTANPRDHWRIPILDTIASFVRDHQSDPRWP